MKLFVLTILTVASLVLAVLGFRYVRDWRSSAAGETNIVLNPSFESGTTGWNLEQIGGVDVGWVVSNLQPVVGSSVAELLIKSPRTQASDARLVQSNLQLLQGVEYTLDFAARSEKPLSGAVSVESSSGQTLFTWPFYTSPAWGRTTQKFISTGAISGAKLVFSMANTLGNVWLDDVKLLQPQLNAPSSPVPPSPTPIAQISSPVGSVKNYYVDCVNGNDTNSGTSIDSAWKSLAPVNSALASGGSAQAGYGYLFKNGCVFTNVKLTIAKSGTSVNPIIVGWYGNSSSARPILLSADSGVSQVGINPIVYISGVSYVQIDGLRIERSVAGYSPSSNVVIQNIDRTGIHVGNGSSQVIVRNSYISGNGVGMRITCNWDFAGFFTTYSNCSHDVRVTNNQFVNNNVMTRNTDGGDDDTGAQSIDIIGSYNNEVDANTFSGGTAASRDYGSDGSGIEIFGARNNVIHHNIVRDSDAFAELGDPSDRNGPTADNTIRNNYYCSGAGKSDFIVARGGGSSFGPTTNTLVDSNSAYTHGAASMLYCDGGCDSSILKVRNNIFWSTTRGIAAIDGAYENTNNTYLGNTASSSVFADVASCNLSDIVSGRGAYEPGAQIPGNISGKAPSAPAPTTASGVPSATLAPTPTSAVLSTPAPVTTLGAEVDTSDTDDTINKFILTQVAAGRRNIAAGGAWWGLIANAHQNQIWLVNRNIEIGKVYGSNATVTADMACVMPGVNGLGTSKNTLNKNPEMTLHMWPNNVSANSHQDRRRVTPNQFYTYQIQGEGSGSQEKRTECHTEETENNLAAGHTPGEVVQANINGPIWFGAKTGPWGENDSANHNGITNVRDFMDSHGWYTDIEYVFNVLENPFDLMGKTVKGSITLKTRVQKSKGTGSIHHRGIKIEQNYKDYWAAQTVAMPDMNPLTGAMGDRGYFEYVIDTTKLTDGWHIVSFHSHAIDKGSLPGHFGMQIASEMKVPVCVNNTNTGKCP